MKTKLVTLYNLGFREQRIVSMDTVNFDPQAYSRMKFGIAADVYSFASMLARKLYTEAPDLYKCPPPPAVFLSYKTVALAPPVYSLAVICLDQINQHRQGAGLAPGQIVALRKTVDSLDDYSGMSSQQRQAFMALQAEVHVPALDAVSPALILDDIRVTGAHSAHLIETSTATGCRNIVTAYIAVCDQLSNMTANMEARLNSSAITCLADILPYCQAGKLLSVRRLLKLLAQSTAEERQAFLSQASTDCHQQLQQALCDADIESSSAFQRVRETLLSRQ